jgi:membrane protein YqaA with SNARE-associated domain
MAIFGSLYKKVIAWSKHPHATRYLSALSFAESSFFPVPVDVMLAPMVLAKRESAWWYAGLATFWSVAGAVLGYLIGMFLFEQVALPIIEFYSLQPKFAEAQELFNEYGIWIIVIAGFSPIPYKVATITAGVVSMPLVPFVLASIVGRGARFYLVAWLVYIGGQKIESVLENRVEQIGWATVVIIVLVVVITKVI